MLSPSFAVPVSELSLGRGQGNSRKGRGHNQELPRKMGPSHDLFSMPNIAGVLRGNTIRGNTTRNFERKMTL